MTNQSVKGSSLTGKLKLENITGKTVCLAVGKSVTSRKLYQNG